MQVKIFITNLAAYNSGYLVGKWVILPLDEEELKKEIEEVLNMQYPHKFGKDEECFITDYEAPFHIHEYQNIFSLNEKLLELNSIQEKEGLDDKIVKLMFEHTSNIDEVIDIIRNGDYQVYYEVTSMADVAYECLENSGLLDKVPEELLNYIDFQRYGNDMELYGKFYFDFSNRMCVEIIE